MGTEASRRCKPTFYSLATLIRVARKALLWQNFRVCFRGCHFFSLLVFPLSSDKSESFRIIFSFVSVGRHGGGGRARRFAGSRRDEASGRGFSTPAYLSLDLQHHRSLPSTPGRDRPPSPCGLSPRVFLNVAGSRLSGCTLKRAGCSGSPPSPLIRYTCNLFTRVFTLRRRLNPLILIITLCTGFVSDPFNVLCAHVWPSFQPCFAPPPG